MPISTEGSGMPTTRPKTGSPILGLKAGVGDGEELFTCPYPPQDQRLALRSKVCMWEELLTCPYRLKM